MQKERDDTKEYLKACEGNNRYRRTDKPIVNLGNSTIYMVTPTHTHPEQKANLVRLSHTLLHVKNIHWIIIEDSGNRTNLVSNFLKKSRLPHTHLHALTPPEIKLKYNDPTWLKPKGVLQRNAGLKWIRENLNPVQNNGVVYFADDDNTYSLEIFEEVGTFVQNS